MANENDRNRDHDFYERGDENNRGLFGYEGGSRDMEKPEPPAEDTTGSEGGGTTNPRAK